MVSYFKRVNVHEVMSTFSSVQSFSRIMSQKMVLCCFLFIFLIFLLSRVKIASTVAHTPWIAVLCFRHIPLHISLPEDILHLTSQFFVSAIIPSLFSV